MKSEFEVVHFKKKKKNGRYRSRTSPIVIIANTKVYHGTVL